MRCKKCGAGLLPKQHKFLKDKMLKQPFFYLRWYKCLGCKRSWNFEEDKIFNNLSSYKPKEKELSLPEQYYEELTSHLK